ncbi:MAG TPA: NAD(P)-dependent oxidoreductase [Rubrivivax sp.]|nr:NAD(P)-dependent oxidoreductase [Rubrivivax sp.]
MRVLVTGSAGHLGDALVRSLQGAGHDVVGIDILASPSTHRVGSIGNAGFVAEAMQGAAFVLHTATLHKPHVATHKEQAFIDTNVSGTLNLLQAAARARVQAFVFTSTTSTFGDALVPAPGLPAAWITEDVVHVAKNIYGATKTAAEDLCRLYWRNRGLPCMVLRTSRFFPEADDDEVQARAYADANLKTNEFLHRRVDIADVVDAHVLAMRRAADIGFGIFIVSATTPFKPEDAGELRRDATAVMARRVPSFEAVYTHLGWQPPAIIDRVYDNNRARTVLGWQPQYGFEGLLAALARGEDPRSPLARAIGAKGYHQHPDQVPQG